MYIYYIYSFKVLSEIELVGLEYNSDLKINVSDNIYIKEYERNCFAPVLHEENMHVRDSTELYFEQDYYVLKYKTQFELCIFIKEKQILVKKNCDDIIQAISILLGTGLGLYFLLHGYIPIHAGAFKYKNYALAFAGWSGVGKSTFIRYAIEKGYNMVTEDTLLIKDENVITVYPSVGIKSKLNYQSIKYFNIAQKYIGEKIKNTQKYWISLPEENRTFMPLELRKLYFLKPNNNITRGEIVKLNRQEKKVLLNKNIISINNLSLSTTVQLLKRINALIDKIDSYIIMYPRELGIFDEMLTSVLREEN